MVVETRHRPQVPRIGRMSVMAILQHKTRSLGYRSLRRMAFRIFKPTPTSTTASTSTASWYCQGAEKRSAIAPTTNTLGTNSQIDRFSGVAFRQASGADLRPSRTVLVNSLARLMFSLNCSNNSHLPRPARLLTASLYAKFRPNSTNVVIRP